MFRCLLVIMLLPKIALAEDWQPLDGDAIKTALSARLLTYEDGSTQQFNPDGTTTYTAEKLSSGQWRVEGAQYCSQWPPSDRWSCYEVARSEAGLDLRFAAGDGSETIGRYTDLK